MLNAMVYSHVSPLALSVNALNVSVKHGRRSSDSVYTHKKKARILCVRRINQGKMQNKITRHLIQKLKYYYKETVKMENGNSFPRLT